MTYVPWHLGNVKNQQKPTKPKYFVSFPSCTIDIGSSLKSQLTIRPIEKKRKKNACYTFLPSTFDVPVLIDFNEER